MVNAGSIVESFLEKLPEQFKRKNNIEVLIRAFAEELEAVGKTLHDLETLRSIKSAFGRQLDGAGEIVVLTRAESSRYAGIIDFDVIDDERYRLFLMYKALRNANTCTFPELVEVCRLLYNMKLLYYREFNDHPAHFQLMVGADFEDWMLKMLYNTSLTVKPGGVSVDLKFFELEFFGFRDLNKDALGFGEGKFLHIIGEE
ncbi:DUF2612 domain-containing protein [Parablautia intestinalis]|uniref:DUF2612 domain-containing protein n=1 Tax=Parablautia intestinalis TaxID=2320100 RepID=A0A3A9AVS1_9FIRM|nr:DUF2612 domain-containing protein [Parablautia intestinalis]RKI90425.1 DUF2612 domain-containing protein [Parablautia intestinalis]